MPGQESNNKPCMLLEPSASQLKTILLIQGVNYKILRRRCTLGCLPSSCSAQNCHLFQSHTSDVLQVWREALMQNKCRTGCIFRLRHKRVALHASVSSLRALKMSIILFLPLSDTVLWFCAEAWPSLAATRAEVIRYTYERNRALKTDCG